MSTLHTTFQHLNSILQTDDQSHLSLPPPPPLVPAPPSTPAPSASVPPSAADSTPSPSTPAPLPPLQFTTGKRGATNIIWLGFRYCKEKQRGERSYWKCTEKPRGCPARVNLHGSSPCCPPPLHNHEAQPSHIAVHLAKKNLKRKAADTDLPSKQLAAACQAELDFEAKSLLGCQENALVKMARLSRQKANHHPVNPTSLETLVIPPSFVLFFLLR